MAVIKMTHAAVKVKNVKQSMSFFAETFGLTGEC
jgi:hypothetical protein